MGSYANIGPSNEVYNDEDSSESDRHERRRVGRYSAHRMPPAYHER